MPVDIISLYRAKLAKEKGTVRKEWGGRFAVALIYPNFYRLGMSNLGFQVVYDLLNKNPYVVAERAFLPEGREMSLYLQSGKPLLSLESQAPLEKFDLLAFSISFENDYVNILKILDMGKIPLLAEKRDASHPLVLGGGITTFLNPEPLAPFMDFFLIGEAEAGIDAFMDFLLETQGKDIERKDLRTQMARKIPGLYVPALYFPEYHDDGTLKSFLPKENKLPEKIKTLRMGFDRLINTGVSRSVIRTPDTEFGDKSIIELGRGCGRSCRFCAAGYVYRPPRFHKELDLHAAVEDALKTCDQLGLLASAVSDVPRIEKITSQIIERGGSFSVSSLRADTISQELIDHLKKAGQKSVTMAPEAGSERLRKIINKHLTKEQIFEATRLISRTANFDIKLYFLIGLPTETREDISEMVNLVKIIKHHMVKESAPLGRMGHIRLSVNCFVPKPFTPFQWFAMDQVDSLKEKQKWIKKTLAKEGGIQVNSDIPKWAYIQTLLSMGDRRVSNILLLSHTFDGDWAEAIRHSDVNPDFFVYRPKKIDELLPWDFIDNGISKEHLIKEYELALQEEESDICRVGECFRCGVCG